VDKAERERLIEQYANGSAELRAAWHEVPESARTWSPADGEWSAHEIVVHCADSETYAATRIRLLTAEPSPLIVGYDQEGWADTFAYHDQPVEMAMVVVAAVREHTTHLIRRLTDEQWSMSGTHTESGSYAAEDWLRTYAAHLHDHASQIRDNVAAWHVRS
jgi:DinB superfamily